MAIYGLMSTMLISFGSADETDSIIGSWVMEIIATSIFLLKQPFVFLWLFIDVLFSLFFAMITCTAVLWIVFVFLHGLEMGNAVMLSVATTLIRFFEGFFQI